MDDNGGTTSGRTRGRTRGSPHPGPHPGPTREGCFRAYYRRISDFKGRL